MNLPILFRAFIAAVILISISVADNDVILAASDPMLPERVELPVPYVAQVWRGYRGLPWSEACEEASIVMVDGFYKRRKSVPQTEAARAMQRMFAWENKTFGKNDDTGTYQTAQIIRKNGTFGADVWNPTSVTDIKLELVRKHPVLAFVNMYTLWGRPQRKDSFHVVVIVGYDDKREQFIVHDPARGKSRRYAYDVMMRALHDYNPETREADGPAAVIFTSP